MKPIIKWSGGKSDEIKIFEKYFPDNYETYIEPFVGGGSVYFNLEPQKAVISDVHPELIDFYKTIANGNSNEIINFMKEHPNTEEEYYKVRSIDITNSIDNASRFYYLRKTCFRGMMRYNKKGGFNVPYGRYKTCSYTDLENNDYHKLLARTEILNCGFEDIFNNEKYNNENSFVFLDPPYDSPFTDYGYCNFTREHHKKLAECFKNTKMKCMIVISETDFIRELYSNYIIEKYPKKYRFKLYDNRINDDINKNHLIITNYKN